MQASGRVAVLGICEALRTGEAMLSTSVPCQQRCWQHSKDDGDSCTSFRFSARKSSSERGPLTSSFRGVQVRASHLCSSQCRAVVGLHTSSFEGGQIPLERDSEGRARSLVSHPL